MREKAKILWRNLRLANKMQVVYFLLLSVVCAVSLATLQVNWEIYDEELYEKSLQELDYFVQLVNGSLAEVETFSYNIALSSEIQQQLTTMRSLSHLQSQYNYERQMLRNMLLREIYANPIIKNVIYTDLDRDSLFVGEYTGSVDAEAYAALLQEMHDARGAYVTLAPSEEYPYLLSGRDILKHIDHSMEYLGTYIITCDVAGLIEQQMGALSAPHSKLYVYGENGPVYRSDGNIPTQKPERSAQDYDIVHSGGQRYFVCWMTDRETGWVYLNFFPYSEIYGQTMRVRYIVLAIFVLLFAVSVLVMRRLARVVTQPLQTLTDSMRVVETGDFQAAKEILPLKPGRDETGQLTEEFRVMLEKIDKLIYEDYKKQLLLQEMRYQMLQAQINPHFLNNTLNTIAWMVKANRNDDASKVIVELGQLLRAALSKEAYTSVAQDIEQVRAYITIQKFRYGSRASFSVWCEGELERYMLPKMVLQPLVENAIYHGIDNVLERCEVSVSALEKENHIFLEVRDTGPGMDRERLTAVRNFTAKPRGHGIGLKNIKERLELAFGSECVFAINSAPGEGTTVAITIPKREEAELHG